MAAEANPEHRSWSVSASNSTMKHGRDKSASAGAATQFPAVGDLLEKYQRPADLKSQLRESLAGMPAVACTVKVTWMQKLLFLAPNQIRGFMRRM
jgi:hypothetical protein